MLGRTWSLSNVETSTSSTILQILGRPFGNTSCPSKKSHLGLAPALSDHVSLTYCEAGHMLYTKKACLDGLHRSMADLYRKALPTP